MLDNTSLTLDKVSFRYKKGELVLSKIECELLPGTITALIGENGCGKTTLLRLLSGITTPSFGEIRYGNKRLSHHDLIQYKKKMGFMPEQLTLYPEDKVYKVLEFLSVLRNQKTTHQQIDRVLKKVGLLAHKNKKVEALSKGLKQRLNFAQAIIHKPKIAIFDEPSNGFDYLGIDIFYNTLKELAEAGAIIILTSHILSELWGRVDYILVMKNGSIVNKVPARFDHASHAAHTSHKLLFLQLNQDIDDTLFSKLSNLSSHIVRLKSDTIKAHVQVADVVEILSIITEKNQKIIDFQVDSLDIQMILRGGKQ